jgi:hypothetical protein
MSNKDYVAECSKHFACVVNENSFQLKHCEGGGVHLEYSATGQKDK